MTVSAKRIGLATLVISLTLLSSGGIVGTALAQTETPSCDISGPESLEDCKNPSLNPFENVLNNIYNIAHTFLQYLGFVAVFAGSTLYLTADSNSSRGQTGLWLFVGGLMLIVLYFGMSAFISLIRGIVEGGPM